MQLTAPEEAEALAILHASGIEGSDATTSLATVCKLSNASNLDEWTEENQAMPIEEMQKTYGHDASRAALALVRHAPR